jgi:hypothetical protein
MRGGYGGEGWPMTRRCRTKDCTRPPHPHDGYCARCRRRIDAEEFRGPPSLYPERSSRKLTPDERGYDRRGVVTMRSEFLRLLGYGLGET